MSFLKSVEFVVSDLEKNIDFFQKALSFELLEIEELKGKSFEELCRLPNVHAKRARMRLGQEEILLLQYISHKGALFPHSFQSSDLRFQHIAIVVSDMDQAYDFVMSHGVSPISSKPQTIPEWNVNAAGIRAFYFRAPEGHPLELIYYPSGKGQSIWQQSNERLFLGIDHTAIAVSHTDRSLRFYERILGFVQEGKGLNYGETQEALSGVRGAKVQITSLIGPKTRGIGVEFLHYLEGATEEKVSHALYDLSATRMVIVVDDLEKILTHLGSSYPCYSVFPGGTNPKEALIADDDGHYLSLLTR